MFYGSLIHVITTVVSHDYYCDVTWLLLWCHIITTVMSHGYYCDVTWLLLWCHVVTIVMSRGYYCDVTWLLMRCHIITTVISHGYYCDITWLLMWCHSLLATQKFRGVYITLTYCVIICPLLYKNGFNCTMERHLAHTLILPQKFYHFLSVPEILISTWNP